MGYTLSISVMPQKWANENKLIFIKKMSYVGLSNEGNIVEVSGNIYSYDNYYVIKKSGMEYEESGCLIRRNSSKYLLFEENGSSYVHEIMHFYAKEFELDWETDIQLIHSDSGAFVAFDSDLFKTFINTLIQAIKDGSLDLKEEYYIESLLSVRDALDDKTMMPFVYYD